MSVSENDPRRRGEDRGICDNANMKIFYRHENSNDKPLRYCREGLRSKNFQEKGSCFCAQHCSVNSTIFLRCAICNDGRHVKNLEAYS
jgi:hypothetical protein